MRRRLRQNSTVVASFCIQQVNVRFGLHFISKVALILRPDLLACPGPLNLTLSHLFFTKNIFWYLVLKIFWYCAQKQHNTIRKPDILVWFLITIQNRTISTIQILDYYRIKIPTVFGVSVL